MCSSKRNYSYAFASVTVLKNNRPWVIVNTASTQSSLDQDSLDIAIDFMDEYADVFEELAK